MENTDTSAVANEFANLTMQIAPTLGFSGAGRVLGDIRLIRQTVNQTNSFFLFSAFREGGAYKDYAKIGYDTNYFVGTVGIGTTTPQATLDVKGYVKLALNSSQPASCSSTNDGSVALTHTHNTCVCVGASTAWVNTVTSVTCSW